MTGSKVRIKGLELVETLASGKKKKHLVSGEEEDSILILAANNSTSYGTLPGALANTIGEQRTLVMMVNFQDAPSNKPWTSADVQAMFDDQVNVFYREASYNQTWFKATVFGWQTIALSSTSCDRITVTNLADQAATAAGHTLSSYDRLVYAFPQSSSCNFSGLGMALTSYAGLEFLTDTCALVRCYKHLVLRAQAHMGRKKSKFPIIDIIAPGTP